VTSFAAWCALTLVPAPASSQVELLPVQDLAFGQLQPGIPEVVLPTDAARRAHVNVTGQGDWIATFTLPAELTSSEGATLPLVFGPTDGYAGRNNSFTLFDPNQPFTFRGQRNRPYSIYLGGTADPAINQASGTYSATIIIFIAQAGA
jgi:hypothetical protein